MKDPYEAYYRHERRQHRKQIAMVVGAFFLTVMVVLGAVLFWHLATDEQVISANTHTTASN
jgi:hypothetical protein